jgi:hypothetical protein
VELLDLVPIGLSTHQRYISEHTVQNLFSAALFAFSARISYHPVAVGGRHGARWNRWVQSTEELWLIQGNDNG